MMDPACESTRRAPGRRTMETKSWRKERIHRWTWIQTRRSKRTMKHYPTQRRIGRIPNRWRFPRIWDRIFRSRCRLVRVTGQDQERSITLGDDFVVDSIDLKKIVEEVVGLEETTVSQDIDIFDDHDDEWVDDWSKPEVEFDDELQQSYEQDLTILCVLKWLNEMTSDPRRPVSRFKK